MLRCHVLLLTRLLLTITVSQTVALPAPPWYTDRRALGEGSATSYSVEPSTIPSPSNPLYPFMTLKPFLPSKPVNPFTPAFVPDPQIFIDKKAKLLNNLFSSPLFMGGIGGLAVQNDSSTPSAEGKPWMVGPGGPWAPPSRRALAPWAAPTTISPWATTAFASLVDPSVFMGKKADFLSSLFSELNTMSTKPAGVGPDSQMIPPTFWPTLPPLAAPTSAPEVTATSAEKSMFLKQLLQALDPAAVTNIPPMLLSPTPSPKPKPLVSPSYWIPTPGSETYMTKVAEFLDKLFKNINVTTSTTTVPELRSLAARHHNNDEWIKQQEWVRAVTGTQTAESTSISPLAAKDLVINSILNEVGELKATMLDTFNELITKQKEVAAAAATTKRPIKFGMFPWGPTPKPTTDPSEPYQKRLETLGQVFDMLTALGQEVATGSSVIPKTTASNLTSPVMQSRFVRGLAPQTIQPSRSIQMAVHQGYQSMPAGTEEIVSAGGGRDPSGDHEGGGINLKIKIPK